MMDWGAFEAGNMKAMEEVFLKGHEAKVRGSIAAGRNVIIATPVDTGRARANWQYSHGEPTLTSTLDQDKNGSATIAHGVSVAQASKPDEAIWLVNNLAYIGALNDGHSKQAPVGFVEAGVQAAIRSVEP